MLFLCVVEEPSTPCSLRGRQCSDSHSCVQALMSTAETTRRFLNIHRLCILHKTLHSGLTLLLLCPTTELMHRSGSNTDGRENNFSEIILKVFYYRKKLYSYGHFSS